MSHEKVKAISLKGNKVYLTSADSSIRPLHFHRWECEPLSKIYAQQGKEAVLAVLGKDIWDGELKLYKGNKLCNLFLEARSVLPRHLHFTTYDSKTAGEFLARMVMKLEKDPRADLSGDVEEMFNKMNDREYILESVWRTGNNFLNYACEEMQKDREINLQVLEAGAGRAWFEYPTHFADDRDFALKALEYNGCFFRDLALSLRADKEIIRAAFREDGRTYHEHLPDLLPVPILLDKDFMKELIQICPSLHLHRTEAILQDKELALTFAQHGKFLPFDLEIIPKEFLRDEEFKNVLMDRFGEGEKYAKLREKYIDLGLLPPEPRHVSLDDRIRKAETRKEHTADAREMQKDDKGHDER